MNFPSTGPIVGVIGGGQLARMMAPVASELGIELRVLAESPGACAAAVVPTSPVGDYTDLTTLRDFAEGVDVVTFDHEHVPTEHLRALLADGVSVHPGPNALIHAQDKIEMRRAVDRLGLPNPRWAAVTSPEELREFGKSAGWPVVLKTPRGGYDGKGVMLVESHEVDSDEVASWFQRAVDAGWNEAALLAEEKVDFSRELSALVARRPSGHIRAWDVAESIQVNSVCDEVIVPAPNLSEDISAAATDAAKRLADELGVTGVMAAELFETPGRGQGFLVNELAMRPHNSGHWTQDGSVTSQFEQHLRAVLDLPLGSTERVAPATVMKNFLGGSNPNLFAAYPSVMSEYPRAKIHTYGKSVRPDRKVGHVNVTGDIADVEELRAIARGAADGIRDYPTPELD